MAKTPRNFTNVSDTLGRGFAGTPIHRSNKSTKACSFKGGPFLLVKTEERGWTAVVEKTLGTDKLSVVISDAPSARKAGAALVAKLNPKAAKAKAAKANKGKASKGAANDNQAAESANDNKYPPYEPKVHASVKGGLMCGMRQKAGTKVAANVKQVTCGRCLAAIKRAKAQRKASRSRRAA